MKTARQLMLVNFFLLVCLGEAQQTGDYDSASQKALLTTNEKAVASSQQGSSAVKRAASSETYAIPNEGNESKAEHKSAWKKATSLYNKNAYAEAIPYFRKVMQADSFNKTLLSRLGDCYRLTNNTEGKLLCYGTLVRLKPADPLHELYYGQALLESGETEKAKLYFEKYGTDSRGKNLASSFGKIKTYKRNADAYQLELAEFNSAYSDICAVKFHDTIVFASSRSSSSWISHSNGWTKGGYMNVLSTKKDETGKHKTPGVFLSRINTKFNDGPVSFNSGFTKMYYTTNSGKKTDKAPDGSYKLRILEATIEKKSIRNTTVPAFIDKRFNYAHPAISADGKTLYFSSDMEGGFGGMDLYRSTRDTAGNWGPAVNLGEAVNTAGTEVFPFVSARGELYFSSNGRDGMGGLDIYEAKLHGEKIVAVYNMGEPVNSKYDDFGFYKQQNNEGFISSNRKSGGMDDDIYHLKILREVRRGKDLLLVLKDKGSRDAISGGRVIIGGDTLTANANGEIITLMDESAPLSLIAIKEDYFTLSDSIRVSGINNDPLIKELYLEKNPKLFLRGLIQDAKSNELLAGVRVKVADVSSNALLDDYTTTNVGDYFKLLPDKRIGDELLLQITLEKQGYLSRNMVFSHKIEGPGEINLNRYMTLNLGKIEEGMDLAKMTDIKPIYFDFGKSQIRPDAAAELDKIGEVMKQHPNMSIELGSHTDCRSSAIANMKLSAARAKASVDYIISKGISKERISGRGYGETKLLNNCACEGKMESSCPEEEHLKNNRTEFLITALQ